MPSPKLVFGIWLVRGGRRLCSIATTLPAARTGGPGQLLHSRLSAGPEAIIYGWRLRSVLSKKKVAPIELKQMEFPIDMYERNKAGKTETLYTN